MPFSVLKPIVTIGDSKINKIFIFDPRQGLTSNFLTELFCLHLLADTPHVQPLSKIVYNKTKLHCTLVFSKWNRSLAQVYDQVDLDFVSKIQLAIAVEKQISPVLEKLHKNGIVHCDVTPRNLLVNLKRQEFRLIDFDCARCIIESSSTVITKSSTPFLKKGLQNQQIDLFGLATTMLFILSEKTEKFCWAKTLQRIKAIPDPPPLLIMCRYKIGQMLSSRQNRPMSSAIIFQSGSWRFLQKEMFLNTVFVGQHLSKTLRYLIMSQLYRLEKQQWTKSIDLFALAFLLKKINETMFGTFNNTSQHNLEKELDVLEKLDFRLLSL